MNSGKGKGDKQNDGGNLHGTFKQKITRTSSSSSVASNGRRRGYSGVRPTNSQPNQMSHPTQSSSSLSTSNPIPRSSPTLNRRPFNQKSAILETTFGPSYSTVTTITTDEGNLMQYHHNQLQTTPNRSSIHENNEGAMVPGAVGGAFSFPDNAGGRVRQDLNISSSSNLSRTSYPSRNLIEEEIPLLFTDMPNSQLFCRLCDRVYKTPVITTCGHSFCKSCVQNDQHCPVDGKLLKAVVPNLDIEEQIGSLYIHCRYGCVQVADTVGEYDVDPNGCQQTVKLSERKIHEDNCDFAPVHCPNNSDCPIMLKKHLPDHLATCDHIKCHSHHYGCKFVGDQESVQLHLNECKYELVKDFLQLTEERIAELTQTVKQRDEENNFLRTMLSKTADRVDELEKTFAEKTDLLSEHQGKLTEEMVAFRQNTVIITNELQDLNTRLNMGGVGLFDPQQIFKCKGTFVGHSGPVWCLCVHGDLLFSGSSDKNIKVWDTATNYKCQRTLEGHKGIVLALTTHGTKLYSGSADCSIKVWEISTMEEVSSVVGHDNGVCTMVCSGNLLFSGSLKIIKVWKIDGSRLIYHQDLKGLNHWVRALFATQNYIYSGSYQTVKIWDMRTMELVQVLDVTGGSVYSITVTNHHILCGTYENCIHVWDVQQYEPVATLTGHIGTVYALACISTPDQTKVFSASYDRSIRVWSMDNMLCTQTLIRHQGSVTSLAISRGRLFSGAVDSSVKVWQ